YPELYGQSKEMGITFMKSVLPGKSSQSTVSSSEKTFTENKRAQQQSNEQVERKRSMPTNQLVIQGSNKKTEGQNEKPVNTPAEKTKRLGLATESVLDENAKQTENTKHVNNPSMSEKIKKLGIDKSKLEETIKKTEESKSPDITPANKSKQLQKLMTPE